jgi:DNA-binding MarR family transcriptional regulator
MAHPTETQAPLLPLPSRLLDVPAFVMLQLLRRGRRLAEATPQGPRLPQLMVLASLDEFGPQSQRELSRRLGFDPSDMVGLLDHLESEGHAVRTRDPADRRRHSVAITGAGRAWLDDWLAGAPERSARLLPGLADDERAQLVDLLRRALANLDLPDRAGGI